MITGVVGLPGAGKTLDVTGRIILQAVKEGRLVVTNINLNLRELRIQAGNFVDDLVVIIRDDPDTGVLAFSNAEHFTKYEEWRKDGDSGQGAVYVVDECHAPFSDCVGISANKHPIVQWMAKHRHKGVDVYLLTQDEKFIPPAIRKRVELFYKFVRKSFLGFNKSYWRHSYDTNGNKLPGSIEGKYNPEWYKLYQSYTGGALEDRSRVPTIWSDWRFKAIAIGTAACVAFAWYNGGVVLPKGILPDETPAEKSAAIPAPGQAPGQMPAPQVQTAKQEQEAEIAKINNEIELLLARRRLERAYAGCDEMLPPAPSEGIVSNIVGGGARAEKSDRCGDTHPLRYKHDQVGAKISGAMMLNAQWVYWLDMTRGPHTWQEKSIDLEPYGFVVMPVSECLAWLKGERGNYRLTCDGPNIIGYEDAVPLRKPQPQRVDKKALVKTETQGNTTTMMMVE